MLKEHPAFKVPSDPNMKLWRYMSLTKFLSMLEESDLHFARADKLGDPFEYTIPPADLEKHDDDLDNGIEEYLNNKNEYVNKEMLDAAKVGKRLMREVPFAFRMGSFVNCWHANSGESNAMWKIYLQSSDGVAVQSTVERLTKEIIKAEENIYISEIFYKDRAIRWRDESQDFNIFRYGVTKRVEYEYENEVRAVIFSDRQAADFIKGVPSESMLTHMKIKVSLYVLIEAIYVPPNLEPWFVDLIKSILKRYGLDVPVNPSGLTYREP